MEGRRIHVTGVVQGVGFRPFVANLASRLALTGWVRNTSAGVDIEVEGQVPALTEFVRELTGSPPPLALIESVKVETITASDHQLFRIVESHREEGASLPVSPDVAVCEDCLRELFDPDDRRYRYPFINCTNCGPRFTIVTDIPYDRPNTTMAGFALCPDCEAEYGDPGDRRYHAQPVACPACGPQLTLLRNGETAGGGEEALQAARALIASGGIVAVKGLGGFHLACDARNDDAVRTLRMRKRRDGKPFALMAPDLEAIEAVVDLDAAARDLLTTVQSPIVLIEALPGAVAPEVAPGLDTLGVMLPYTPLHHLLLERAQGFPELLVMTSGNMSEEPIAYRDEEAFSRLSDLADAFLVHDRPIHMRCDDSVVMVINGFPYPLRRARGYAPLPLLLPMPVPQVLAAGGELKNTFCLARERRAFLSHHIGDLDNLETVRSLEEGIAHYERLFRIRPELLACDLHPDYRATRYVSERAAREDVPVVAVQHHHAHIASCLADNGLDGSDPVIGVSFDGTGYGPDGAIWGGEFLVADYSGYERPFHLAYVPLPGGDAAIRNPYRTALAWLRHAGVAWEEDLPPVAELDQTERGVLERQLEGRINAPLTSSMGRLFDAASSIAGLCQEAVYEAQAAIEFEAVASDGVSGAYRFGIADGIVDPTPALRDLVREKRLGVPVGDLSARFHNGVVTVVVGVCHRIGRATGLRTVALSGGVWQNRYLLRRTTARLTSEGFEVLVHRRVPANDGGLALGQAMVAVKQHLGRRA